MRVATVTHVCIFLNGRQIQTADLNKFAEYVFFEKDPCLIYAAYCFKLLLIEFQVYFLSVFF